jgi:hypothetical protein
MTTYTAQQNNLYNQATLSWATSLKEPPRSYSATSSRHYDQVATGRRGEPRSARERRDRQRLVATNPDPLTEYAVKLTVSVPPETASAATPADYARLDALVAQLDTAIPTLICAYPQLPTSGYEVDAAARQAAFKGFIEQSARRCIVDFEARTAEIAAAADTPTTAAVAAAADSDDPTRSIDSRMSTKSLSWTATDDSHPGKLGERGSRPPWERNVADRLFPVVDELRPRDLRELVKLFAREVEPERWAGEEISEVALSEWRNRLSSMPREAELTADEKSLMVPICGALVEQTHVAARDVLRRLR